MMIGRGMLLMTPIIIACTVACGDRREAPPAESASIGAQQRGATHSWAVTAFGAGGVRAGMSLAEAAAASPAQLSAKRDWSECTYLQPSPGPEGLMFMVFDGRIARVDVITPDIPTAEGVRVGDSEARVREVYGPDRVVTSPHEYIDGSYLTVAPDANHRLVFETDGSRVTRFRGGRLPEVEWVEGCS